jgi:hypothetical protein
MPHDGGLDPSSRKGNSVLGARFMQSERQITAALDLQIGSGMPLIKK